MFSTIGDNPKRCARPAKSTADVFTLPPGYDPGHEASHEGDQIIYVIEGSATARISGEERQVKAGDLVMVPALAMHTLRVGAQGLFAITILAPPKR